MKHDQSSSKQEEHRLDQGRTEDTQYLLLSYEVKGLSAKCSLAVVSVGYDMHQHPGVGVGEEEVGGGCYQ